MTTFAMDFENSALRMQMRPLVEESGVTLVHAFRTAGKKISEEDVSQKKNPCGILLIILWVMLPGRDERHRNRSEITLLCGPNDADTVDNMMPAFLYFRRIQVNFKNQTVNITIRRHDGTIRRIPRHC